MLLDRTGPSVAAFELCLSSDLTEVDNQVVLSVSIASLVFPSSLPFRSGPVLQSAFSWEYSPGLLSLALMTPHSCEVMPSDFATEEVAVLRVLPFWFGELVSFRTDRSFTCISVAYQF